MGKWADIYYIVRLGLYCLALVLNVDLRGPFRTLAVVEQNRIREQDTWSVMQQKIIFMLSLHRVSVPVCMMYFIIVLLCATDPDIIC